MQAQDLSYKLNNQILNFKIKEGSVDASVEVFSFENIYTVPGYSRQGDKYRSLGLVWGNTEPVSGGVELVVSEEDGGLKIDAAASLDKNIRCIKVRLDGLPLGRLVSLIDKDHEVTEYGAVYNYPEGWRSLSMPLLVFRLPDGEFMYIRCLDKTVNPKRFFIKKVGEAMRVDVVCEADGTSLDKEYTIPTLALGFASDADSIYEEQSEIMKRDFGLSEFTDCKIAPDWLKKDISLVVTMHMQTFTGYMFHTYESALEDIRKLTEHIDGRHILVYLTGWEGRYYYKYGDYTPDDRMGGAEGLKKCVDGMHELGCKVMAMYGINYANKNLPEVAKCIPDSEIALASGGRFHNGSVNWEGAHHYDFNEFVTLSVAGRSWRECLFGQIKRNTLEFGFDGAFLDIAAAYYNDKNNRFYDGVVEFCDMLRGIKPDFLVAGEGFYDGLAKAMPLFQSGHTDGEMNYHDRVSESCFTRFSREFAHLCLGDLSRGSSGVHELGINTDRVAPYRRGIIPTLCLVEDTLSLSMDEVIEVCETAKKYHEEYNA